MERSRMIGSVDNFDGQQNLQEWIQMVNRAAEFAGWTDDATFKAAMFRLRGEAGEHAEQLKSEGKITSWPELQVALKDRFETAGKEQIDKMKPRQIINMGTWLLIIWMCLDTSNSLQEPGDGTEERERVIPGLHSGLLFQPRGPLLLATGVWTAVLWARPTDNADFVTLHWVRTARCGHEEPLEALPADSVRRLMLDYCRVMMGGEITPTGPAVNVKRPDEKHGGTDFVFCLLVRGWWPAPGWPAGAPWETSFGVHLVPTGRPGSETEFIEYRISLSRAELLAVLNVKRPDEKHGGTDYVFCLLVRGWWPAPVWPDGAPWDTSFGVHLVPTGRSGSKTESIEYRISLSRAELLAVRQPCPGLRAAVGALKAIKNILKESGVAIDDLKSYFMKTAALWLAQEPHGGPRTGVTDGVHRLLDWLERRLDDGVLPCFFYPDINVAAELTADRRRAIIGSLRLSPRKKGTEVRKQF
ncbi:hypothetical protein FJT64_020149 [Amphibalanus amphitrite]|uniref:Uncharacterized protein n=1 Tax=Amphibalanus amphitrite TaxID=1232801 RepID=A0A6A4WRI6_AMPAM|nr:hypothetical protein FJT64_020149 [Amphibalanus amphitrite]